MLMIKRMLALLLALFLFAGLNGCELPTLPSFTEDAPDKSSGQDPAVSDFKPTVYTEVIKEHFEKTYADQLSPNEKAVYDAVASAPICTTELTVSLPELPKICQGRSPTDAEMSKLSDDIGSFTANALYAAWLDFPTLFWLDHTKYSYDISVESDENGVVFLSKLIFHLSLTAEADVLKEQQTSLDAVIKGFVPLGATTADKIAYINAYLVSRIEYDLDAPNRSNIIGALVDGKCVCEGYARAFDYLAQKAGIDAVCIPGYAYTDEKPEGEGHMWNGVLLDGKLYAVDATWNDTTEKNSYLLVGADTVCDEMPFGDTHKPNMLMLDGPHKTFALPEISGLGYGTNP